MQFFQKLNVDFIGKRAIYFFISSVMIIATVGVLVMRGGPILGIDFTGGTFLQVGFKEMPQIEEVRGVLASHGVESFSLQTQPANHSYIIRIKSGDKSKEDIANELMGAFVAAYPNNVKDVPERIEFVGPVIGDKLIKDTFFAVGGSLGVIILFVAFRFKKWVWGVAGVLALAHDVFITVGFLTILNREITLVMIAALLTLAGYSINDTIVIFDRVRENLRAARKETAKDIFNRSINETLSRTFNTSFTTLLAAGSLLIFGGEVIHDFALSLVFGIVIGTYSSIAVAISLVFSLQYKKR